MSSSSPPLKEEKEDDEGEEEGEGGGAGAGEGKREGEGDGRLLGCGPLAPPSFGEEKEGRDEEKENLL